MPPFARRCHDGITHGDMKAISNYGKSSSVSGHDSEFCLATVAYCNSGVLFCLNCSAWHNGAVRDVGAIKRPGKTDPLDRLVGVAFGERERIAQGGDGENTATVREQETA